MKKDNAIELGKSEGSFEDYLAEVLRHRWARILTEVMSPIYTLLYGTTS